MSSSRRSTFTDVLLIALEHKIDRAVLDSDVSELDFLRKLGKRSLSKSAYAVFSSCGSVAMPQERVISDRLASDVD